IAQDETTSLVFGMPKEAIALGAAKEVLPIDAIAPRLRELCLINTSFFEN
ncbi:MAG: chemotaxis response regulator protein-glutamate methylesterase, partial [Moorea sp. SIO3G5]|nr:chemotaxis response regulator protein-glutamate methylesterase [Moorena sp. SIO3G5]